MAKKASCKCKKEECEECPEWIFTFADLVMLMMGFFVILWVLKPAPGKDGQQAALPVDVLAAIRDAMGYVPDPNSKDPVDAYMMLKNLQRIKFNGAGEKGKLSREIQGAEGTDPEVTSIRLAREAVVGGRVLFDVGGTTLTPDAKKMLDQIANQIRGHRNIVLVKGHTGLDDFADAASAQQKMDLSIRRAQAAADYLVSKGVDPEILRVLGCSTFEPVIQREYVPNTQSINRRAEVEATATLVEELQDQRKRNAGVNTPSNNGANYLNSAH